MHRRPLLDPGLKQRTTEKQIRLRILLERIWRAGRPEWAELRPGLELVVIPDVFHPRRGRSTAELLITIDDLHPPAGGRGLDLGTGTGAAAICLAQYGLMVDAVDINPQAVQCARLNSYLNAVGHLVRVHQGDLFGPVLGHKYDIITFNPPYLDGLPMSPIDSAFFGGEAGEVVQRFFSGVVDHLVPNGKVVLSYSTRANVERLHQQVNAAGMKIDQVQKRRLGREHLLQYVLVRDLS